MGRDWHKSKECYLKAAECHKDNGSLYHAAKSYEQIVMVLRETQNWVEMTEFGHRAANLLQQQGSHESASSALERVAKMVESEYPAGALELYHHAVETIVVCLECFCGGNEYANFTRQIEWLFFLERRVQKSCG